MKEAVSWCCKRSLEIILRDQQKQLLDKNTDSIGSFEWQKMIKIYQFGDNLHLKTLSFSIEIGNEYIGASSGTLSDVINIFTSFKENYHQILALKKIYLSTFSIYPQRFFKNTVKNLSFLLMKHYIEQKVPL